MAPSPDFLEYLQDQLAGFGAFEVKRMFGGAGLFRDGLMFGLVAGGDVLHFKVDDGSRRAFEAEGTGPFTYLRAGKSHALKSYYEVPERLLEDPEELAAWARRAFQAALSADRSGRR